MSKDSSVSNFSCKVKLLNIETISNWTCYVSFFVLYICPSKSLFKKHSLYRHNTQKHTHCHMHTQRLTQCVNVNLYKGKWCVLYLTQFIADILLLQSNSSEILINIQLIPTSTHAQVYISFKSVHLLPLLLKQRASCSGSRRDTFDPVRPHRRNYSQDYIQITRSDIRVVMVGGVPLTVMISSNMLIYMFYSSSMSELKFMVNVPRKT